MSKFYQIINKKIFFQLLIRLLQFHFFCIYIQCMEYNRSIINNIILFNEINFRYLSFATYSNGDMILLSTAYPKTEKRIFYGFKKNGRPFFKNEASYFYSMNSTKKKDYEEKFESDILPIKLSDGNEKEYLISIGKINSFCEIYDFENQKIYKKEMKNFANYDVFSYRNTGFFLFSNKSDHYYLFGFEIKESNICKYSLQIHKFNTIENFNNYDIIEKKMTISEDINERNGISCFITKNQTIVCFYLTKILSTLTQKNNVKYNIIAYDINLNQKENSISLSDYSTINIPFYRCIHLKEEVGVFSYYKYYDGVYYPILIFRDISSGIENYTIPDIKLNQIEFDPFLLKNDLIKLKEHKICFSSTIKDKTTIYIILINLLDDKEYKVRYYSINLENIYNYIIFSDIRTHNYNNFISFAFSYCNGKPCSESSDLYEFLINNYNLTIKDFNVNLENEVRIENNIFGYVFDGISIQNIYNCLNPQLISSSNNNIIINTTLSKNESIKLKFNENNYSSFNCKIEYIPILTEPDLITYDQYPIHIEGQNETTNDNFKKEKYYGKLTYYNIYLSKSLSDNCIDANCHLCLDQNKSFCITCKYNFTFESSTKEKYCNDNIYTEYNRYIRYNKNRR